MKTETVITVLVVVALAYVAFAFRGEIYNKLHPNPLHLAR